MIVVRNTMLEHEVVAFQCLGIKSLLVRIVARSSHRQLKRDFDLEIPHGTRNAPRLAWPTPMDSVRATAPTPRNLIHILFNGFAFVPIHFLGILSICSSIASYKWAARLFHQHNNIHLQSIDEV